MERPRPDGVYAIVESRLARHVIPAAPNGVVVMGAADDPDQGFAPVIVVAPRS